MFLQPSPLPFFFLSHVRRVFSIDYFPTTGCGVFHLRLLSQAIEWHGVNCDEWKHVPLQITTGNHLEQWRNNWNNLGFPYMSAEVHRIEMQLCYKSPELVGARAVRTRIIHPSPDSTLYAAPDTRTHGGIQEVIGIRAAPPDIICTYLLS